MPLLENIPQRIEKLPRDYRGYPVPWFVHFSDDGVPDFRIMGAGKIEEAIKYQRCWICGERLGRHLAFVIGPMCLVNRISAEPPSHLTCAEFAVRACPFLSMPKMKRNEHGLEDKPTVPPPGVMLARNPGATVVWVTRDYKLIGVDGGVLFRLGEPIELTFYAEGRPASREEVDRSVATGLPLLMEMAQKDGEKGVKHLEKQFDAALVLLDQHLPHSSPVEDNNPFNSIASPTR